MDDIQLQYQQEASRITAAYDAFRQVYSQSTPAPERLQRREGVITLLKGMLLLMLLGAVVVSGSHTIHVFSGESQNLLVGYSAFLMAELGLISFSIFKSYYEYRIERKDPKGTKAWVTAGLVVIVITAVSANVLDVVGGGGVIHTAILLAVALSAPLLVFITGEVTTILFVIEGKLSQQADADYRKAEAEWQAGLTASWNSNKAKWGAKVQIEQRPVDGQQGQLPSVSVRPLSTGQDTLGPYGHSFQRKSNATELVIEHLRGNPADAELTSRVLGEKLGVGKSTVALAVKTFKAEQSSS